MAGTSNVLPGVGGGAKHPAKELLFRETSVDNVLFLFNLATAGHQLQLSIKEQIERKAFSMIGFAGVAVALQTTMLADITRQSGTAPTPKGIIAALVVSSALILSSCICCLFATVVRPYAFPDIARLCSSEEFRRDELITIGRALNALLQASQDNALLNKQKTRILQCALFMFVTGLSVLVVSFLWTWSSRLIR